MSYNFYLLTHCDTQRWVVFNSPEKGTQGRRSHLSDQIEFHKQSREKILCTHLCTKDSKVFCFRHTPTSSNEDEQNKISQHFSTASQINDQNMLSRCQFWHFPISTEPSHFDTYFSYEPSQFYRLFRRYTILIIFVTRVQNITLAIDRRESDRVSKNDRNVYLHSKQEYYFYTTPENDKKGCK